MARTVTVTLTDDIEPEYEADETVVFALDGVEYEIDLASVNADKLRAALGTYIEAGRRVGGRAKRGAKPGSRASIDREQSKAIRAWANANGYEVSSRGRIPQEIIDAYNSKA
ncbi:Protein lsr2 OS=Tsukamurella paurometabola (strain ATCC 8368 / DSM / CCUG 35730 / CIP 100753/ JCM 10117 / KCTC 9821 / NBRC 16120 / NCIMB 702349 / NCTC 13040) OX=521096 GN=Tpau_0240 PE=4 SV=1 [Tsukamurella paurometabola]|uniref:Protein lsr2 n=1 Tax=Tsukamurella paurometabola (strain ATCC 8368 / DSM 20162 / CCUG 35730 / CIP 100753 / JCM 10117 / KCTC 9821 / NBRC 16120 / NCIMB 702349 / NCTC 13040) TaxID=521096 RepID=D5UQQ7_TSUPD|nr:Lsr2 family protein [Tsukamurella paurometabola]ADG76890.1 protein lsr2 precursor [Tsukamurella paurometabola DSM 20162]SUP42096.1 Lsr2 [Tsukamurella paurometabola]